MTISKAEIKRREALKAHHAQKKDESCAFRQQEHFWKSRLSEPQWDAAFNVDAVTWLEDDHQGLWKGLEQEYTVRRTALQLDQQAREAFGSCGQTQAYTFDDLPGESHTYCLV